VDDKSSGAYFSALRLSTEVKESTLICVMLFPWAVREEEKLPTATRVHTLLLPELRFMYHGTAATFLRFYGARFGR